MKTKKRGIGFWILLIILLFFIYLMVFAIIIIKNPEKFSQKNEISKNKQIKYDNVEKYANLTSKQLIKMLGKPNRKKTKKETFRDNKKVKVTYYTYKNVKNNGDEYEFLIIKNHIAKLHLLLPNDKVAKKDDELLEISGITPGDDICKINKNKNSGIREWQHVNNFIDVLRFSSLEHDNEYSSIMITATYDQSYFGYMVVDTETSSKMITLTETNVESILKSPSSAKFCSVLDFVVVQDGDSIIVQGYVDSANSFGVNIRSQFQLTYRDTLVTSFIFDGKELL